MQAPSRTRELLVALFLLGALLFAPPLLIIFNQAARVFGVPTLYLYLFTVWQSSSRSLPSRSSADMRPTISPKPMRT